jgi:hypothetical protein
MRNSIFVIVMMTAGVSSATAQDTVQPAAVSRLFVNGRQVEGSLLKNDQRFYVSIDALAQALGGSVSYEADRIVLRLPELPSTESASKVATGTVKGTISYYDPRRQVSVPDSSAKLFLIKGTIARISEDSMFLAINTGDILAPKGLTVVKTTIADGSGNYELISIPPGEYTLIIQSNHKTAVSDRDLHGVLAQFAIGISAGNIVQKSFDF